MGILPTDCIRFEHKYAPVRWAWSINAASSVLGSASAIFRDLPRLDRTRCSPAASATRSPCGIGQARRFKPALALGFLTLRHHVDRTSADLPTASGCSAWSASKCRTHHLRIDFVHRRELLQSSSENTPLANHWICENFCNNPFKPINAER